MLRSLAEINHHLRLNGRQVHQCRKAEVQIRTRKLLEVFMDELLLTLAQTGRHTRNGSKVHVRIDQSGNEIFSFFKKDQCSGRLFRSRISLDARDAAILNQHTAVIDVVQVLRRTMTTSVIKTRFVL